MKRIFVVGSLNSDLVIHAPYMPVGGETLMGRILPQTTAVREQIRHALVLSLAARFICAAALEMTHLANA